MAKKPTFGGALQSPEYYEKVSAIIRVLRDYSTLRVIAAHLQSQGLLTPARLPWTRLHVANFIRSPHYKH